MICILVLMYLFYLWVVYVSRRHYVFIVYTFMFLVSHCGTSVVIYIMRLFMVYVFYFMFCENKKFILVYLYFPHMRLCFCLVFQEFTS